AGANASPRQVYTREGQQRCRPVPGERSMRRALADTGRQGPCPNRLAGVLAVMMRPADGADPPAARAAGPEVLTDVALHHRPPPRAAFRSRPLVVSTRIRLYPLTHKGCHAFAFPALCLPQVLARRGV